MSLSIIIVNYNTRELLRNCLKAISQGLRPNAEGLMQNTEIIIVDNGSTDASREYLEQLKAKSSQLKTIFNNRNLGFAKAVNQGIKKSTGDYLLLLNTDTQLTAGSIQSLIKFSKKNNQTAIVAPQLLNPDGSIQPSCFKLPTIIGAFKKYWLGKETAFGKYAPKTQKPVVVEAAVAAVWLLPSSTINQVGLFDEKYFMYFEDLDYCRRVKKAGLKIYYFPQSKVVHLHGASGKNLGAKPNHWLIESSKEYHGLINHYLLNLTIRIGQKSNRQ